MRQWEVSRTEEFRIRELRKAHIRYGKMKLKVLYAKEYGTPISSWKIQRVIEKHQLYFHPVKNALLAKKRRASEPKRRIAELKKEARPGDHGAQHVRRGRCDQALRGYPSRQQIAALSEIPFTEATLEQCKETHVLVAVFPLSILEIRGKVAQGQRLFYDDQDWYNKQTFAKEKGETEWKLVRKTPVDNSTSKTWSEQQALLANNEETPTARVMVYTIIGHFLSTGERLFEKIYVRCSDVDSGGSRVCVGDFGAFGLYVGRFAGGYRRDGVGVSAARKFD